MSHKVEKTITNLRFGDLVQIDWLDASEAKGRLEKGSFDTPVCSVGWFLGLKGRKTRHLVIAKEFIRGACAFHYNVIPLGMVENVRVFGRKVLDAEAERVLKKFVHATIKRLKKKDGWVYGKRLAETNIQ
jgi:hypothetical protein